MSKNKYILPFKGNWYIEYGGTKKENSHSWEIIGQRFAYDFEIRKNNLPYHDNPTKNENYYSYLENIYAPADGWVVEITNKYSNTHITEDRKIIKVKKMDFKDIKNSFRIKIYQYYNRYI